MTGLLDRAAALFLPGRGGVVLTGLLGRAAAMFLPGREASS